MICALFYNFVCNIYFFDEAHIADKSVVNFSSRTNILYCAIYFVMGGLIYLYKKEIKLLVEKKQNDCDNSVVYFFGWIFYIR